MERPARCKKEFVVRRPCAIRVATGLCSLVFSAGLAFAGATSQNIPPVDPTAKNLTPYMISLRAFDACLIVQSRLQSTTREAVHTPCSCYAKLTVKNMTKEELDAFRETGYFNDSARQKALEALDTCKLPRPPLG
jgi:predicted metal-binding protein